MNFVFSYDSVPTSPVEWEYNPYRDISFETEEKVLVLSETDINPLYSSHASVFDVEDPRKEYPISFLSEQKKFYIAMKPGLYNLLSETAAKILRMNQEYPGSFFICDRTRVSFFEYEEKDLLIFKRILEEAGVSFQIVDFEEIQELKIKNFCMIDKERVESTKENIQSVRTIISSIQESAEASKIVYLSMQNSERDAESFTDNGLSYTASSRIVDEQILEAFFLEQGIEVVRPHEIGSPEEQVNYFKDVKVILSATSSGMGNAFFMPAGGLLVEFSTPFDTDVSGQSIKELHLLYSALAYKLGHTYVSIPNQTRASEDIIEAINGSKIISYINNYVSS